MIVMPDTCVTSLHAGGRGFESRHLHQPKNRTTVCTHMALPLSFLRTARLQISDLGLLR